MNRKEPPIATEADEPIAIVGIGCRFPGGSDNPSIFWEVLSGGVDAISEVPEDRWNTDKFYDPAPAVPGRTQARLGGFVKNVDAFDAEFFGIPPREAACVDPQQRLLLETAWEALEDGGMPLDPDGGGNIGVYVGISTSDYGTAQSDLKDGGKIDMYTPTGSAISIAANRVSYCLNLKGPSLSVDTACSSSLVSVHLACRSLLSGECEAALAGGVNFILNPDTYVGFSRMSMLSPDGRCKPFDSRGNGFTRGEGAGMLLLKPLSAARKANDRIYAVIRGTAVNQDGKDSAGMTMPAQSSQESVIRAACRRACIDPGEISYVEAHGTGTPVGDPVEAQALGSVIGQHRKNGAPLYLGSVKSNIGHLESGAGIAGLTKAALALYHRTLPPSLHFETPNPNIDFEGLNLEVTASTVSLPKGDDVIYAGINSFGFGGTNAHVVLGSSPPDGSPGGDGQADSPCVLPLTARSESSLRELAGRFRDAVKSGGLERGATLHDICHTMAVRRFHHPRFRGAVVASNLGELTECLDAISEGELHPDWCGLVESRPLEDERVVFVFCGQGPQWFAMGRDLLKEDEVFRSKMEECDRLIRQLGDWSLLEELAADEDHSRIQDTSFGQPAIFAIQVSLAERWMEWGIEPAAVVGHSVGEVAAAHLAGVLNLKDAIRVIYHRGRCMAKAKEGAMLAAGLSKGDALELLASYGDSVCLAASNSPTSVTLSGEASALKDIAGTLDQRGVFQKPLRVHYAFHSNQMDPIEEELVKCLEGLSPSKAQLPLYSTVSGFISDGLDFAADYWWRNVRQSVQFSDAIEALSADGYRNFLEVGPHPVLTSSISETLRPGGKKGNVFHSLRRKESERVTLLKTIGELFAAGLPVNWQRICPGRLVNVPGYTWEREYYWNESEVHRNYRLGERNHPFLGENRNGAEPSWESRLGERARNLMDDHRVQGRAIFPAAGYLEMALEAARQTFGDEECYDLEGVEFLKGFFLPSMDDPCRMRMIFDPEIGRFRIYSEMVAQSGWVKHCSGEIHVVPEGLKLPEDRHDFFGEKEVPSLPGGTEFSAEKCYEIFESCGIQYGPKFRGLKRLFRKDGEALGLVRVSEEANFPNDRLRLNPAVLDSCFHAILVANPNTFSEKEASIFLPARIERLRSYCDAPEEVWSHVVLRVTGSEVIVADICLFDERGKVIAELEGFTCHAAGMGTADPTADWLYEIELEPVHLPGEVNCRPEDYMIPCEELAGHVRSCFSDEGKKENWGHLYEEKKLHIDELCQAYIRKAFTELGWNPQPEDRYSTKEVASELGVGGSQLSVVDGFLQILAEDGYLDSRDDEWVVRKWGELKDPEELWRSGLASFPSYHMEYMLIRKFGRELGGILSGQQDPMELLLERGSKLTHDILTRGWSFRRGNQLACEAVKEVISRLPKGRKARILEIGGGTGGLSDWILRSLTADNASYVFSDSDREMLSAAEDRFNEYSFIEYKELDIGRPIGEQGFEADSFDMVVVGHALHSVPNPEAALSHCRELTAPEGVIGILEFAKPVRWHELVFGVTDGWGVSDAGADSGRTNCGSDRLKASLQAAGYDSVCTVECDNGYQSLVLASKPQTQPKSVNEIPVEDEGAGTAETDETWLLFADRTGVAAGVAEGLRKSGRRAVLFYDGEHEGSGSDLVYMPSRNQELIEAEMAALPDLRGVLHFWSLDLEEPDSTGFETIEGNLLSVVQLVHSATGGSGNTSPHLWLITRGAQPDEEGAPVSVSQAPVLGLCRTINTEYPSLRCRSIDLDPAAGIDTEVSRILEELGADDGEGEVLLRGEGRYCPRLTRTSVERQWTEIRKSSEISYGLGIRQLGVIDSMVLKPRPRIGPGPGQIEIEVVSGALNFRDVMKALGIYPTEGDEELVLGDECAGRITRIGKGVTKFAVGDRVTAVAMGVLVRTSRFTRRLRCRSRISCNWRKLQPCPLCS